MTTLEAARQNLVRNPLDAHAYIELATLLRAQTPPRLTEALQVCQAARRIYPMSPVIIVTEGGEILFFFFFFFFFSCFFAA